MIRKNVSPLLFAGDAVAILAVTWIGFLTHKESVLSARGLATFLPVTIAWAVIAPWLGNYRDTIICNPRQSWRAGLAMLLAAPLAGFLRALMLNSVVLPVFVAVLGGTSALGMLVWRLVYALIASRAGRHG